MTHDKPAIAIPDRCWLSEAVSVRTSDIEGKGLFATRPIAAGEVVSMLGGRLIDDAELGRLTPPYSSLCVSENQHILIDPAHPVRYGNHSCDPNLWHRDATTIVARRNIDMTAELTLDYATHTLSRNWTMRCSCGSRLCRGTVTGSDWQLASLQQAYGRHWTPPLLRAIDSGRIA